MSQADMGDSQDLEDLFDSIAGSYAEQPPIEGESTVVIETAGGEPLGTSEEAVFSRIGHMTRNLHDTLRQLGYDKSLEDAVTSMPDARERLSYIADLTEKAAVRVLTATEQAKPLQDTLEAGAKQLSTQWQRLFNNELSVDEFKQLALQTHGYLNGVPQQTQATNTHLTEIMMAQDFQDLTGQVIKKVTQLAQDLEQQLLQILVAATPQEKKKNLSDDLLNGPVINPEGRTDVVTSQEQVDELLESLGF